MCCCCFLANNTWHPGGRCVLAAPHCAHHWHPWGSPGASTCSSLCLLTVIHPGNLTGHLQWSLGAVENWGIPGLHEAQWTSRLVSRLQSIRSGRVCQVLVMRTNIIYIISWSGAQEGQSQHWQRKAAIKTARRKPGYLLNNFSHFCSQLWHGSAKHWWDTQKKEATVTFC